MLRNKAVSLFDAGLFPVGLGNLSVAMMWLRSMPRSRLMAGGERANGSGDGPTLEAPFGEWVIIVHPEWLSNYLT